MGDTSSRGRYRDVLRHRDFRLLVGASLIDQIGSWAYSVVLAVYVYDRTGSAVWLAAMTTSGMIVSLVCTGFAGVIADRFERTRVMLASALCSGLVMTVIAFAVGLHWPVWLLLLLRMLSAVVLSPYRPAAGALTPELVSERELATANSLFAVIENGVVVVGPAIGGLLLLVGPAVIGVVINAASFFAAAAIIVRLGIRSRGAAEPGAGLVSQWLVGVRALAAHRVAFVLVLFVALDSTVYGISTVVNAPLSVHLGTGVTGYSYLLVGSALGCVLAAGLANRLSARPRLAPVIISCIALQTAPYVVVVWVHSPVVAFVLMVLSGAGMVIVDVLGLTALQRDLDGGVLSRVLGAFDALVLAAIAIGSFVTAAVLSAAGLTVALLSTTLSVLGLALLGLPLLLRTDRTSVAEAARLEARIELLGALDLFAAASRPVLERLAKAGEERQVPAGETIIRQGDAADALWILLDGALAVQIAGEERVPPDVTAPGYVGELGLVRKVARTATVTTRTACTLLRIDGTVFVEALETATPSASFVQLTGARWSRTPRPTAPSAVAQAEPSAT